MWLNIIMKLNVEVINDLASKPLEVLRQYGQSSLMSRLTGELLMILTNIPESQSEFGKRLNIIISLCETIASIWE